MTPLLIVVALMALTACAANRGTASAVNAAGCNPSPVSRDGGGLPVVQAGGEIEGLLFYYDGSYKDVAVAVMPPHGRAGPDRSTKILWRSEPDGGPLTIRGTNLTGPGMLEQAFPEATSPEGDYPSIIELPRDGCWELTIEVGNARGDVTFATDSS